MHYYCTYKHTQSTLVWRNTRVQPTKELDGFKKSINCIEAGLIVRSLFILIEKCLDKSFSRVRAFSPGYILTSFTETAGVESEGKVQALLKKPDSVLKMTSIRDCFQKCAL